MDTIACTPHRAGPEEFDSVAADTSAAAADGSTASRGNLALPSVISALNEAGPVTPTDLHLMLGRMTSRRNDSGRRSCGDGENETVVDDDRAGLVEGNASVSYLPESWRDVVPHSQALPESWRDVLK